MEFGRRPEDALSTACRTDRVPVEQPIIFDIGLSTRPTELMRGRSDAREAVVPPNAVTGCDQVQALLPDEPWAAPSVSDAYADSDGR